MSLVSQKMNLDYIRTFVVLGQSRNMYEASKKMEVDASYVSRHIKGLEETLSLKLVIPSTKNKKLQLTEAGKYFFNQYEKIYNEILLTEKEYRQNNDLENAKFTIGINLFLQNKILKSKLKRFNEKYPDICIKIVNDESEELINNLNQFAYDIIITSLPKSESIKLKELKNKELFNSNYCIAYDKNKFNVDNLNNIPFILPLRKSKDRILIDDYFKKEKVKPIIKYELNDNNQILNYVKEGVGVGILPKELLDASKLECKNIDIDYVVNISYIDNCLTNVKKEFLKMFDIDI